MVLVFCPASVDKVVDAGLSLAQADVTITQSHREYLVQAITHANCQALSKVVLRMLIKAAQRRALIASGADIGHTDAGTRV